MSLYASATNNRLQRRCFLSVRPLSVNIMREAVSMHLVEIFVKIATNTHHC